MDAGNHLQIPHPKAAIDDDSMTRLFNDLIISHVVRLHDVLITTFLRPETITVLRALVSFGHRQLNG